MTPKELKPQEINDLANELYAVACKIKDHYGALVAQREEALGTRPKSAEPYEAIQDKPRKGAKKTIKSRVLALVRATPGQTLSVDDLATALPGVALSAIYAAVSDHTLEGTFRRTRRGHYQLAAPASAAVRPTARETRRRVLALFAPGEERSTASVCHHLSDINRGTIWSALSALTSERKLVRVHMGVYRLPGV